MPGEFLGRRRDRLEAHHGQAVDHVLLGERGTQRGVDLLHDRRRRAARREEAEPFGEHQVLVALLGEGRHARRKAAARGARHAEEARLAGADLLRELADRPGHRLDLARDHVLDGGLRAAIGDVLQLDAARLAQQHADEVRHRAGRRRAVVGLVRVGLAPGQELREGLHAVGHGGADAEAEIEGAGQRHRGHVGEGVVGQLLVDVRIDHQHRRRRLQDDAAVGRRALHRLHGDLAAGARLVLDQRALGVGAAAQVLGDPAAERVGRAARREAGDDLHDLERLAALRAGAARQAEGGKRSAGGCSADEAAAIVVHGISPLVLDLCADCRSNRGPSQGPTALRGREPSAMFRRAGPVAQLDRALPSEGRGREFESRRVRHQASEIVDDTTVATRRHLGASTGSVMTIDRLPPG